MNSDRDAPDLKLPDGWVLCESKSTPGRKYYFNRKTGKSSWTEPRAECSSSSKQKNKTYSQQKNKRDKVQKKNLKRKSDGQVQEATNKKQKRDLAPQRHSTGSTKFSSPRKHSTPFKNKNTPKSTPTKNLANARLSQLRSQLNAEVASEEASSSDSSSRLTFQQNMSPNSNIPKPKAETPTKVTKQDLKSPTSNESRCSTTTQSPSNDSLNSHPSPSQFFTANKIISAMKAQLPDEYCSSSKQNDTFADIEKGISNQTTEYPYSKHPATPPQFSEASKLVSAIKSKLSYSPKDSLQTFSSAKERMEKLQTSFTSQMNETTASESSLLNSTKEDSCVSEAMEVEDCRVKETNLQNVKEATCSSEQGVTIIVDTNIFIHELDFIKNVLNSHIKGYSEQPTLLVPWRVISELDRLKDNNNGSGAVCKRAKAAMDYLYKSLPENTRIKGQSLRDSNSHIYPCEVPDDEILNCCLQQVERGKSVILLSNDKNLCNKGTINGVTSKSLCDLKSLLESKPLAVVDPELGTTVKHCKEAIYELLTNILENEMRAKYDHLWQHVVFLAPPWSLADALQCLLKHWIAVFSDVFPRIEPLINDLRNSLAAIDSKDIKSISQSEASNFKELCLDIAKRCQIIPEYMHLAKLTVGRIEGAAERGAGGAGAARGGTELVIEAFESIWTVFSSYCSKLCAKLGIENNIEDKLEDRDDSLETLISKWTLFTKHANSITLAMRGALSVEISDGRLSSHVRALSAATCACLHVLGARTHVHSHALTLFCINCRNMLQEAHDKFTELTELLLTCKNSISN